MTTQDLTIKLKLKDDASKAMKTASGNVKTHAGKIKANLAKIGTIGGAGLMIASAAALKLGDMFKEAENIIAAGTGATGENLEDLKESFKDVFAEVPDDAATVASAIADVNTAFGFTGDKLEKVAELALGAGRAMGEDMAGLIAATADALIAFDEPMTDAESLMDKLTVASQNSGASMKEIADKVVKFGPQLNAMGIPLDDSIALIANMEAKGIDAGKMMPGLSGAMKKLADEGVTDISGALQDAITDIGNTEDDTEALAKAMEVFGAGAGVQFADAIKKGAFEIDGPGGLMEALANSDGALGDLAASTLTSSEKFGIMKNKVMGALEPIGAFASAAGPMLMMLPALTTLTAALSGAKVFGTAVTWAQTAAQLALNVAMLPVTLVILAIVAAIVLIIAIIKNWDKILAAFQKVWDKFKDGIQWLRDNWSKIWDKVKTTFKTVTDKVKSLFTTAFGWIMPGGSLSGALEKLANYWSLIWNFMKDAFNTVVSGLKGGVNIILSAFNALIRGANKIKIGVPKWVPVIGGKSWSLNIPEIPYLAKGGIVRSPTLAMVGEKGPEAVIPLGRGGAGMGVTVNINFPARGTVLLGDDMAARKLAQALTPLIRQALRGQPGFA